LVRNFRNPPPAADEVDDLDLVALPDRRHRERLPLEHDQIVLDRNAARVDVQLNQKLGHRQGAGDLVRVAVQGNLQFPTPILASFG
jgi:hypothetical protein